jgi:hypothetical protein
MGIEAYCFLLFKMAVKCDTVYKPATYQFSQQITEYLAFIPFSSYFHTECKIIVLHVKVWFILKFGFNMSLMVYICYVKYTL